MPLTALLRTLEDDAGRRVEAILSEARADAARIVAESEAKLARRREAELGVHEAELRADAARAVEACRRLNARRVLEARATALARVRAEAEARLAARSADRSLLPLLRRDLQDGLGYLGRAPAVIEADPTLLEALRETVKDRRDVAFVPVKGAAGLVIRAEDGGLVVDASLAGRLERGWASLAIELARRLERNS